MEKKAKSIFTKCTLVILFMGQLACNDLTIEQREELTVEMLLENTAFVDFANANKDYTIPFLDKIARMNIDEFNRFYSELEALTKTQKDKNVMPDLVRKMGFENQEYHDRLYSKVAASLDKLFAEFPQLESTGNDRKQVLESALKHYYKSSIRELNAKNFKNNVILGCDADLEFCQGMALSMYLYRTAACVGMGALNPFIGPGCQIANSSLHSAEQASCLKSYKQCTQ